MAELLSVENTFLKCDLISGLRTFVGIFAYSVVPGICPRVRAHGPAYLRLLDVRPQCIGRKGTEYYVPFWAIVKTLVAMYQGPALVLCWNAIVAPIRALFSRVVTAPERFV